MLVVWIVALSALTVWPPSRRGPPLRLRPRSRMDPVGEHQGHRTPSEGRGRRTSGRDLPPRGRRPNHPRRGGVGRGGRSRVGVRRVHAGDLRPEPRQCAGSRARTPGALATSIAGFVAGRGEAVSRSTAAAWTGRRRTQVEHAGHAGRRTRRRCRTWPRYRRSKRPCRPPIAACTVQRPAVGTGFGPVAPITLGGAASARWCRLGSVRRPVCAWPMQHSRSPSVRAPRGWTSARQLPVDRARR